jgi:hypothetical protein
LRKPLIGGGLQLFEYLVPFKIAQTNRLTQAAWPR